LIFRRRKYPNYFEFNYDQENIERDIVGNVYHLNLPDLNSITAWQRFDSFINRNKITLNDLKNAKDTSNPIIIINPMFDAPEHDTKSQSNIII
jgi:hypothetical protein